MGHRPWNGLGTAAVALVRGLGRAFGAGGITEVVAYLSA